MVHPRTLDFAVLVAKGQHVGPYRVRASRGDSGWLRGADRLTLSPDGTALAYLEQVEGGWRVHARGEAWGPYGDMITRGPRFDAEGGSVAWIVGEPDGGYALYVDGRERTRARRGSFDPHDGSPLELPFDGGLTADSGLSSDQLVHASPGDGKRWKRTLGPAGGGFAGFDGSAWRVEIDGVELARVERVEAVVPETFALTTGGAPVLRALERGRWRAFMRGGATAAADWMSPPALDGDDAGFVMVEGARVLWRSYRAGGT